MGNAMPAYSNNLNGGGFIPQVAELPNGDAAVALDPKAVRKEAVGVMKKNLIMDAAQRVIARDGYVNAKLENIAEEAGFSKAAIYHYFADKEEILAHMIIRELRLDYGKCHEATSRTDVPFAETLKVFVMIYFDNEILENGDLMGGIYTHDMSNIVTTMTKHETLMGEAIGYKLGIYDCLRQVIARAREKGEFNFPADDHAACMMILAFITRSAMLRQISGLFRNVPTSNVADIYHLEEEFKQMDGEWIYNTLLVFLKPWLSCGGR